MFPSRLWLVLFLVLGACRGGRATAERALESVDVEALRREAAVLYKQTQGARGAGFVIVGKAQWPPTFRGLAPVRVGSYPDGFSIALRTDADTEQGLYVIPLEFARPSPTETKGARFERLAEGVFWYEFPR